MKSILYTSYIGVPNPHTGGSNKVIYEILRYHNYDIYDVHFISSQYYNHYKSASDLQFEESDKLTIKRKIGQYLYNKNKLYNRLVLSQLYQKLFFVKSEEYLKKKIEGEKYDIVHNHDVITGSILKDYGKKSILTVHSKGSIVTEIRNNRLPSKFTDYLIELRGKQEIQAIKSANVITYPSKAAFELHKADLESNVSEDVWNKVQVIYNGIDIERINAIEPDREFLNKNKKYDLSILNIAAHVKEKNILSIIEAIRIIKYEKRKKVRFVNIGEGPLTDQISKQIRKYNLASEVKLLGEKTNEEVISLLKSFDYLLMPSERVVFDIAILEGLACGICIIASNDGGNREVLKDGENAYLLQDTSPTTIVNTLLLNKVQKIEYNPHHMIKKFTSSKMVENYNNLYQQLIM